jgi:hypothetical protein
MTTRLSWTVICSADWIPSGGTLVWSQATPAPPRGQRTLSTLTIGFPEVEHEPNGPQA